MRNSHPTSSQKYLGPGNGPTKWDLKREIARPVEPTRNVISRISGRPRNRSPMAPLITGFAGMDLDDDHGGDAGDGPYGGPEGAPPNSLGTKPESPPPSTSKTNLQSAPESPLQDDPKVAIPGSPQLRPQGAPPAAPPSAPPSALPSAPRGAPQDAPPSAPRNPPRNPPRYPPQNSSKGNYQNDDSIFRRARRSFHRSIGKAVRSFSDPSKRSNKYRTVTANANDAYNNNKEKPTLFPNYAFDISRGKERELLRRSKSCYGSWTCNGFDPQYRRV
ncbi:hypothetical protein MMC09_004371 [Bachmanniomyces sp. S44760]|nr:hypothetical protein [Bachmanniomyces sp. S44760]